MARWIAIYKLTNSSNYAVFAIALNIYLWVPWHMSERRVVNILSFAGTEKRRVLQCLNVKQEITSEIQTARYKRHSTDVFTISLKQALLKGAIVQYSYE